MMSKAYFLSVYWILKRPCAKGGKGEMTLNRRRAELSIGWVIRLEEPRLHDCKIIDFNLTATQNAAFKMWTSAIQDVSARMH